jgi:5S rRNA maturation endonuclease (ribonuclease M5)
MLKKMKRRYIVLVEGPRDAIRLIGFGIPALAILGSNNWSEQKRDLLMTLDLDMVLFAFDNDKGGKLAYKNCAPSLKGFVHRIKIKITGEDKHGVGYDPGNCPKDQIYYWIDKWKLETANVRKFEDHYPEIEEEADEA